MSKSNLGTSVVVLGEAGVGKTCFTDQFLSGRHFVRYDPVESHPFTGEGTRRRTLEVDGELWSIHMEDLSTTPLRQRDPGFRTDIFEQALGHADGIVLLYDVTSKESYEHVIGEGFEQAWLSRNTKRRDGEEYLAGGERFGCVLVGNRIDLLGTKEREVRKELAAEWAMMQGMRAYELDSYHSEPIEEAMIGLVRSIEKARRRDNEDLEKTKEKRQTEDGKAANSAKGKGKEKSQNTKMNKRYEKTGLSGSLSRLRNALPHIRSKSKTTA